MTDHEFEEGFWGGALTVAVGVALGFLLVVFLSGCTTNYLPTAQPGVYMGVPALAPTNR